MLGGKGILPKFGNDGGTLYQFQSGINENEGIVSLGGVLKGPTTIGSTYCEHDIAILNRGGTAVKSLNIRTGHDSSSQYGQLVLTSTSEGTSVNLRSGNSSSGEAGIYFFAERSSPILITDTAHKRGVVYAADYSANYTDRSLVDKAFVLSKMLNGGIFSTGARDALTFNAGDIIFNVTIAKHQGYDGTVWNDLY